jgi:hypothetical protein
MRIRAWLIERPDAGFSSSALKGVYEERRSSCIRAPQNKATTLAEWRLFALSTLVTDL